MSSMYSIGAVLVLDADGERIASKFYNGQLPGVKEQRAFEKSLWNKTYRANSECILFEQSVVVYKCAQDVYFYVLGNCDENELILLSALQCLTDALARLLRGQLDKRTLLENLDFLLLCIDELTDDGILMESDGIQLATRVAMKSEGSDVPLSEQTLSQAVKTAKDKLENTLLR